MRILTLMGGCSLLAITTPALAQVSPSTPPSQAGGQTDEGGTVQNHDIIVTASKREQTLQDTPISVSVTPAETIERMINEVVPDEEEGLPALPAH